MTTAAGRAAPGSHSHPLSSLPGSFLPFPPHLPTFWAHHRLPPSSTPTTRRLQTSSFFSGTRFEFSTLSRSASHLIEFWFCVPFSTLHWHLGSFSAAFLFCLAVAARSLCCNHRFTVSARPPRPCLLFDARTAANSERRPNAHCDVGKRLGKERKRKERKGRKRRSTAPRCTRESSSTPIETDISSRADPIGLLPVDNSWVPIPRRRLANRCCRCAQISPAGLRLNLEPGPVAFSDAFLASTCARLCC